MLTIEDSSVSGLSDTEAFSSTFSTLVAAAGTGFLSSFLAFVTSAFFFSTFFVEGLAVGLAGAFLGVDFGLGFATSFEASF